MRISWLEPISISPSNHFYEMTKRPPVVDSQWSMVYLIGKCVGCSQGSAYEP
jgi:hypothetical protein